MVLEFQTSYFFPYSWPKVTLGSWLKYPNKHTLHVKTVDVIARNCTPSEVVSTRLISCEQKVHPFLARFLGGDTEKAYVCEMSLVSLKDRRMIIYSQNLTFSNLVVVEETCTYTPDPSDIYKKTLFFQNVRIETRGIPPFFSGVVESILVTQFKKNANTGRIAMTEICNQIGSSPLTWVECLAQKVTSKLENSIFDSKKE